MFDCLIFQFYIKRSDTYIEEQSHRIHGSIYISVLLAVIVFAGVVFLIAAFCLN